MYDTTMDQQRRPIPGGQSASKDNNNNDDDERNHHRQPSQTKRRKQAAISLTKFSTKKGHDRALQEYKKRREMKFQKNATLLREYQKAMKKEGYDAGRGASRKRRSREEDLDDDDVVVGEKEERTKNNSKEIETVDHEVRKKEMNKREQERKVRAKKMMQRTRRGQPLIKNVIGDLLVKIKSEVEGDGESA
jgi:hypothetical protein